MRIEHRPVDHGPKALLALGLTAREAEVLYWITEGKTEPGNRHHPGRFSGHREEACRESLRQAWRANSHFRSQMCALGSSGQSRDRASAGSRNSAIRPSQQIFLDSTRFRRIILFLQSTRRGCSSVGRALPCQGRCREFESRHPLHFCIS